MKRLGEKPVGPEVELPDELSTLCAALLVVLLCGCAPFRRKRKPGLHIELIVFRRRRHRRCGELERGGGVGNLVGESPESGSSQVGRFVGVLPASRFS